MFPSTGLNDPTTQALPFQVSEASVAAMLVVVRALYAGVKPGPAVMVESVTEE